MVPQHGRLAILTEFGQIDLEPLEVCILPRGMVFKVTLPDGEARGFVCENYGAKFTLPTADRSAPTAWPIRATSRPGRGLRG